MTGPPPAVPSGSAAGVEKDATGIGPADAVPSGVEAAGRPPASPATRLLLLVLAFVALTAVTPLLVLLGCATSIAAGLGAAAAAFIAAFASALFPRFSTYSWQRRSLVVLVGFGGLLLWVSGLFVPIPALPALGAGTSTLWPQAALCLACIAYAVWLHRQEISHPRFNPLVTVGLSENRDFLQALNRYCRALKDHLDRYDNEVNWSDRELTPLQAEVQSEERGRLQGSVAVDLVEAVRRDQKADVFLVLGDPGSGKSVSLRRLVRMLCVQAPRSGVVPVYVNLREFPAGREPTTATLLEFVRNSAFDQTGRDGRIFVDRWYESFRRGGRLFLVIDSFDELPAVLDSDDKSDSHRRISTVFNQFFSQEVQSCRAVLASRLFRSPANFQGARLVIRPFSEGQLLSAMKTWLSGQGIRSAEYVQRVFLERPQLVPALRNPFSAELIADFAIGGAGERLPDSLFAVFDAYVAGRLSSDGELLVRFGVGVTAVRHGAGLIAEFMYRDSRIGLEATVDDIKAILTPQFGDNAQTIMNVLVDAKISRLGGRDRKLFSFVHRRFAEFFVVDLMLSKGLPLKVESIPEDSRWRDCLVMYCGVAPLEARIKIADYCWSVIDHHREALGAGFVGQARPAVHAIRFMADAFRGDREVLDESQDALGRLALELLASEDILVAKIGAELIPLVPEDVQQQSLVVAFSSESAWICETALNGCRHLAHVSDATSRAVRAYLTSLPLRTLLVRFKELNFSLALSDAFRFQLRYLRLDLWEAGLLLGYAVALCMYSPFYLAIALMAPLLRLALANNAPLQFPVPAPGLGREEVVPSPFVLARSMSRWMVNRFLSNDLARTALRAVAFAPLMILLSQLPLTCRGDKLCRNLPLVSKSPLSLALFVAGGLIAFAGLDGLARLCRASRLLLDISVWKRWGKALLLGIPGLAVGFGAIAIVIGALAGVAYLAVHYLPSWVLNLLEKAFLTLAIIIGAAGFAVIGYAMVRGLLSALRDRRLLASTGVPFIITCNEAYAFLQRLQSVDGRHQYLDLLLYQQVKLSGGFAQPSANMMLDVGTRERISKLQEQWENLGR